MADLTIEEALKRASFCMQEAGLEHPRAEAEILLAHFLGLSRLDLFLKRSEKLPQPALSVFNRAVSRRKEGEPSAYITGEKYFYGYRFAVNRAVLIPRPETEIIVDRALARFKILSGPSYRDGRASTLGETFRCVDLGTGCGALAVTIALKVPSVEVYAVDLSAAALQTAKANALYHGVEQRIHWFHGSFFEPFKQKICAERFHLILANPPYLDVNELNNLSRGVRNYEPLEALSGGSDGLDAYRLILRDLPFHVNSPAAVIMEIGYRQEEQVVSLLQNTGIFSSIAVYRDLADHPRVVEGLINSL